MTENKYDNKKDPLEYKEILDEAGWTLFQRDECQFYFSNAINGRIIEIFTDYEFHEDRSEEQNQNWAESWARYQLCELLKECWTEKEITKKIHRDDEVREKL